MHLSLSNSTFLLRYYREMENMLTNAAEVRHYLSEMLPKSEINLWLVCSGFRGAAFIISLNNQTLFCETSSLLATVLVVFLVR